MLKRLEAKYFVLLSALFIKNVLKFSFVDFAGEVGLIGAATGNCWDLDRREYTLDS